MFNFTARGTRAEVLHSLGGITNSSMGEDPLGIAIRDAVSRAIEEAGEPVGRYYVRASGDGHAQTGPATCQVTVTTEGLGRHERTGVGGYLKSPALPRITDYPPVGKRLEQEVGERYEHTVPPDWPA